MKLKRLFVACPTDDVNVQIVWADDKELCLDILAERSCEDYAYDHVLDRSINFSFAEKFYTYNGKFIWDMHLDGNENCKVNPDIEDMFLGDYEKIYKWVDKVFKENVRIFFSRRPDLADSYLDWYFDEDMDEPEYLDEVVRYMVRYSPDWIYWDIQEVDLTAAV